MSEHLNAASRLQAGALGIGYLLCQVAVLRSNLEKQRFEFLVVSAGCASLVRGCPAQIALRFVSLLYPLHPSPRKAAVNELVWLKPIVNPISVTEDSGSWG